MGTTVRTDSEHNLQEYTYKKITPCDVCSQVLRGEFFYHFSTTNEMKKTFLYMKNFSSLENFS